MVRIRNIETGKPEVAIISPVHNEELAEIDESGKFVFTWRKEKGASIFKLEVSGSKEIIGLLSLVDISHELRLHISVIESSKENVGRKKKYDGIAGILIAFSCQLAFENGYDGFVSLTPKTLLIELYRKKYGFIRLGRQLATHTTNSNKLIKEFLKYENE